jgi:diguanylate cyclase (GGDEF)-like protein
MNIHYDITLLMLSVLASCVATLITIELIERLYISSISKKKILLPIFTMIIGSSIWANHILLSFAFKLDLGEARNVFPYMTLLAWGFGCFTAFLVLNETSKRYHTLFSIVSTGILSGFSTLAMYYFDSASIHGFLTVPTPSPFMTFASLIMTMVVITGLTFALSRQKPYWGANPISAKLSASLIVTLCLITIHAAFDQAFAHGEIVTNTSITTEFMGIIISLVLLTLILISFIFILFFEKHGKQIFKFSFLNPEMNKPLNRHNFLDSLTKLPNRLAFQEHLERAAKRSDRAGNTFALAYIDLDHFKPINDQYGHQVGDIVLTRVAERLNNAMRGCDFVARIGGDEFVAIFEDIKSNDDLNPILERALSSIKEPFIVNEILIEISCSIGIAIYPKDGNLEKLIVSADAAMYKAKEAGKNQYKFYDANIELASDQMLEMQRDLKTAIDKNEFNLAYLAKFDCKSQSPVGAEALIRWNHPTKGEIPPKVFLPVAERFGLINQINDWVVEECCRTIFHAKEFGIDLNLSINLNSQQFRNPNLVEDITKLLDFYEVNAHNLTVEINETIAVKNQAQFKLLLSKFKAVGIRVALDDFGLYPISLAYLQNLNVNELKLDRVFVSEISQNSNSRALADAVIQLAHALKLNVVAEGVESDSQHDTLIELGCDHMQGFLFSKPVPMEKLFNLYTQLQFNFESTSKLLA